MQPTPEAPAVSIIVPCRNEARELPRFLAALDAQASVPGPMEILIAEGRSTDGTRQLLTAWAARHPQVRLIDNPEGIVSTGLNRAILQARADVIVRMDVHTRYADDYVATCLAVLAQSGADNVGGPTLTEADGPVQRAVAAACASAFAVGGARARFVQYEGEVETVVYGCWRRETLLRVGMFDEALVRNQDDELNLRLRRGGGRIWQSPRIRSWYRPRASLRALYRQYYQYGFWKVAVIRKHTLPASWRHLAPAAFVASVLLLAGAAPWWGAARPLLAAELGAYALFMVAGSLDIARRAGWDLLPLLPPTLACYHLGYGLGFLHGMFRGRARGARVSMSTLSR